MFLKRFFKFVPRSEYSRALDLFNDGHYKKALRVFEDLLARQSHDDDIDLATVELFACESHVALSKQRLNEGKLDEAIAEMEAAVTLKPSFADLRFGLGSLLIDAKRYDEAKTHFHHALEINPKFFKAKLTLARVMYLSGKRDEAATTIEGAAADCPTFYREHLEQLSQALRVSESDKAVGQAFREILEERPTSAQVRREVAVQAIQNGDYAEAIRELKKSISVNPDYPDLHNFLGIAYGNSGMSDDAIEEFETALKINPFYLKARLNLALALYDLGRFQEAHEHIDRVLSVQPDNQLAKNLLAEIRTVPERK
jgi:tetratricopeptide (TPR) repeat protein